MWYNHRMSVRAVLALLCAGAIFTTAGCMNGSDAGGGPNPSETPPPPAEGALAWATDKGITVSVLSLSVEQSSTTIVYYVSGRPDLGAGARVGEPITGQSGQMVMPRTGETDQVDGRKVTVTYGPIPATPGTLKPNVSNITFWDPAAWKPGQPMQPNLVEGKWLLEVPYDGTANQARTVSVEAAATPFGPGTFELLGATIESGVLVIEGRLAGYSEVQAQAMHVSILLTGSGGDFAPANVRTGFGPGLSGLTARFPTAPPPGHYAVRLTIGAPSHPYGPEAVKFLQPYVGITAERGLDIP